jgi:hypothetical protein
MTNETFKPWLSMRGKENLAGYGGIIIKRERIETSFWNPRYKGAFLFIDASGSSSLILEEVSSQYHIFREQQLGLLSRQLRSLLFLVAIPSTAERSMLVSVVPPHTFAS